MGVAQFLVYLSPSPQSRLRGDAADRRCWVSLLPPYGGRVSVRLP